MATRYNAEAQDCNGCGDDYTCDQALLQSWREHCPPARPWSPPDLENLPSVGEIYAASKTAVVRINTQTGLTNAAVNAPFSYSPVENSVAPFNGLLALNNNVLSTVQNSSNSIDTYFTYGNGFFLHGHYIVCPAHLVLLPPSLLAYYSVYKGSRKTIQEADKWNPLPGGAAQQGTYQSQFDGRVIEQVSRILVDVFELNGSKTSNTYEAQLLGVDGVNDIAILKIPSCPVPGPNASNPSLKWNSDGKHMKIKDCHPYLEFGCSAEYRAGQKAYVVGDVTTRPSTFSVNQSGSMCNSNMGIIETTVTNIGTSDYIGLAQMELVTLASNAYSVSSGAPILNKYGKVIGIQTLSSPGLVTQDPLLIKHVDDALPPGDYDKLLRDTTRNMGIPLQGDGVIGGPSQKAIVRSIQLLLWSITGCIPKELPAGYLDKFIGWSGGHWDFNTQKWVPGASGSGFRYIKHAYLGVASDLVTASTFSNVTYSTGTNQPRYDSNGVYSALPDSIKEVKGYRIRGLAGNTSAASGTIGTLQDVNYLALPGVSNEDATVAAGYVDSPLLGVPGVAAGAIIASINKMPLGDLEGQGSLRMALDVVPPGDEVQLYLRLIDPANYNNDYSSGSCTVGNKNVIKCVKTVEMPPTLNFPWYKYADLPTVLFLNPIYRLNMFLPYYPVNKKGTNPARTYAALFPML